MGKHCTSILKVIQNNEAFKCQVPIGGKLMVSM